MFSNAEELAGKYRSALSAVLACAEPRTSDEKATAIARRLTLQFGDFQLSGLAPVVSPGMRQRIDTGPFKRLRDKGDVETLSSGRWTRLRVPGLAPLKTIDDVRRALLSISYLVDADGKPTARLRAQLTILRNRARQASGNPNDGKVEVASLLTCPTLGDDYPLVSKAKDDARAIASKKRRHDTIDDRAYKTASAARDLCKCLAEAGWIPPIGVRDPTFQPWLAAPELKVWAVHLEQHQIGKGNKYAGRFARKNGPLEYLLTCLYHAEPPTGTTPWRPGRTSIAGCTSVIEHVEAAFKAGKITRERRRETRQTYRILRELGVISGPDWQGRLDNPPAWSHEASERAAAKDWSMIRARFPQLVDGHLGLVNLSVGLSGDADLRASIGLPRGRLKQLYGKRPRAVTPRSHQSMGSENLVRYLDDLAQYVAFVQKTRKIKSKDLDLTILAYPRMLNEWLTSISSKASSTRMGIVIRLAVMTAPTLVNLAVIEPGVPRAASRALAHAFLRTSARLVSHNRDSLLDEIKLGSKTTKDEKTPARQDLIWLGGGDVHKAFPNLLRARVALARAVLRPAKAENMRELLHRVQQGQYTLSKSLAKKIQRLAALQLLSVSAIRDEELRRIRVQDLVTEGAVLKITLTPAVQKMKKEHALPAIKLATGLPYRDMQYGEILSERGLRAYDLDVHNLYVEFARAVLLDGEQSDFFLVPDVARCGPKGPARDPKRAVCSQSGTGDGRVLIGRGVWTNHYQFFSFSRGLVRRIARHLHLNPATAGKNLYFPRRVLASFLCYKEKQGFAQKLLGHARIVTTMRYYDGLLAEDTNVSDVLDSAIDGAGG